MKNLQEGMFVRIWPTGEIGMIMKLEPDARRAELMFVNNGQRSRRVRINLIPATRKQIKEAGVEGVGCVEPPE